MDKQCTEKEPISHNFITKKTPDEAKDSCIVKIDKTMDNDNLKIFSMLNTLGYNIWQLYFVGIYSLDEIQIIVNHAKQFPKVSIQLSIKYNHRFNKKKLGKLYNSAAITRIDLYDMPFVDIAEWKKFATYLPFYFHLIPNVENDIEKINANYFYINSYSESKNASDQSIQTDTNLSKKEKHCDYFTEHQKRLLNFFEDYNLS